MKNSDKPAFPEPYLNHPDLALSLKGGLTKREYFAAMAMQGLCANSIAGIQHRPVNLIQESLEYADELLKQLEK